MPVAFVPVGTGHSTTRSAGGIRLGGTVSFTSTSALQALEQPLLVTFRNKVKLLPQALPAATVTVCALVGPEMEPLPVMDQEQAFNPAGPPNCVVDRGQTNPGVPGVIEQAGSGVT